MSDHSVTIVPEIDPAQRQISPDDPNYQIYSPFSNSWFNTTATITSIPEESVGWLVSQGWEIVSVSPDTSTIPTTYTYSLQRQSLNHFAALQQMMASYIRAYNVSVRLNSVRYNDIVNSWDNLLEQTHDHFGTQIAEQNNHIEVFLGDLDTYMDAIDALANANTTTMTDMVTAVDTLVGGASGMTELMAEHVTMHGQATPELLTDYSLHEQETLRLLDALLTSEEARIDEKYTASLTSQTQKLRDVGLSASTLLTDIEARNNRDKSQELNELYDKLTREKLQNQHQLYGQKVAMRAMTMEWKERLFGLRSALLQYRVAQERQDAEMISSTKQQTIAALMNTAQARLQWLAQVHEQDMQLMKYQLDEQNKLIIGLYGFVERREDVGPSWDQFAQIAVALGDSGGGWISP